MSIPQKTENLDVTVSQTDRGQTYIWIGEHFEGTGGWRPGTRSFYLNISDPEQRRLSMAYLAHMQRVINAALEAYKPVAPKQAPASTAKRASWVDSLDGKKPVTGDADALLSKLGGRS